MDPFEQELADCLSRVAHETNLRPGSPNDARRRAQSLRVSRRRASMLSGALVAVTATIWGIIVITRSSSDQIFVGDPGGVDSSVPAPLAPDDSVSVTSIGGDGSDAASSVLVPSSLTWTLDDSPQRLADLSPIAFDAATGSLYAIGTQPGTGGRKVDAVALRSSDGAAWEPVGTVTDTSFMRNLAAYDGHLYGVSTAAITASIADGEDWGDIVTRTSPDGVNWTTTLLPGVDVRAVRKEYRAAFSQTFDVQAGPRGTLIAHQVAAFPDATRLGIADATSVGLEVRPGGIFVPTPPCADGATYTPDGQCELSNGTVVAADPSLVAGKGRLMTWTELGLDAADVALYTGKPRFFLSTSSGAFREVAVPTTESGFVESVRLLADEEGFAALITPRAVPTPNRNIRVAESQFFTSPDGLTWTQGPPLPGDPWVEGLERSNGVLRTVTTFGPTMNLVDGQWQSDGSIRALTAAMGELRAKGESNLSVPTSHGPSGIALETSFSVDPFINADVRIEHQQGPLRRTRPSRQRHRFAHGSGSFEPGPLVRRQCRSARRR
jgi:hypothetical protein